MARSAPPDGRRLYRPDGSYYVVPFEWGDEEIRAFMQRHPEIVPEPNALGVAREALFEGPLRGLSGTAINALQGIMSVVPDAIDAPLERGAERAQEWLAGTRNPYLEDSYLVKLGEGIGSTLPFLGMGITGAGLKGAAALGALTGMGEQEQRIKFAEQYYDKDVSAADRLAAALGGAAIGTLEAAPIGRLAGKVLPEALSAGARRAIGQNVGKTLGQTVASAMAQGLEEAAQESTSNILQNAVSMGLYDPEQPLLLGLGESASVGAGAGAVMDIMLNAAAGRIGRFRGGRLAAEEELRKAKLARDLASSYAEKGRKALENAQSVGLGVEEVIQSLPEYDIQQGPEGFFVVNDKGERVSSAIATQEEATAAVQNMNDDALGTAVAAGVIAKLQTQGLDRDPFAVHMGILASHPAYTAVPVQVLARYVTDEGASAGGDRLDPRSRGARAAMALGRTPEELGELGELEAEKIPEARAKLREQRGVLGKIGAVARVKRPAPGKVTGVSSGYAEVSTDYQDRGNYRVQKNAEGKWEVWFPGAIAPQFVVARRADAIEAIREWEHQRLKDEAKEAYDQNLTTQQRREAALRGRLGSLETRAGELAPRTEENQNIYDQLVGMTANGQWFVTMEEAYRTLSDQQFNDLVGDLAMRSLATIADMNQDLSANRTKNGIPRLRSNKESNELADAARNEMLGMVSGYEDMVVEKKDVEALLESKGYNPKEIDSDAFKYLALQLTGLDFSNWSKIKRDQRKLLYARLASLPERRGAPARGHRIPDLRPPLYTRAEYDRAVNSLPVPDPEGRKGMPLDAYIAQLGLSPDAWSQLEKHMVDSNVAEIYSRGNRRWIKRGTGLSTTESQIEAGEALIRATPGGDTEAVTELLRQSFQDQREAIAAEYNLREEVVDETLGTPESRSETAQEAGSRLKHVGDQLLQWIQDVVGPKRFSAASLELVEDLSEISKKFGTALAGSPAAALVIEPGRPARILVEYGDIDPDGVMSDQEIIDALLPRVAHETFRWMREKDYFEQAEWDQIRAFTRNKPIELGPNKGKTFADIAREQLGNPEGPGSQEMIDETAGALAFAEYVNKTLKGGFTAPTGFRRAVDSIRNVISATRKARIAPVMSIFGRMERGRFGEADRGPGLSDVNPAGQVRSTLLLDREVNPVRNLSVEELAEDLRKYVEQSDENLGPVIRDLEESGSPLAPAMRSADILGRIVREGINTNRATGMTLALDALDRALSDIEGTDSKSTAALRALTQMDAINDIQRKAKEVLSAVAGGDVGRARSVLGEIAEVAADPDLLDRAIRASTWVPDVRAEYYGGDQPPITDEQAEALENKRVDEMNLAERMGVAPVVGANASIEALNVFYNNLNPDGTISPMIRQRFNRNALIPDVDADRFGSTVNYEDAPPQTMIEAIQDNLEAWQNADAFDAKWELVKDNFKDAWLSVAKRFRANVLDRRMEVEDFERLYSNIQLGPAETLYADQSAVAAIRNNDRLMHYVGSLLRHGHLVYVGADGQTRSSDPGSGFIKVQEGIGDGRWKNFFEVLSNVHTPDGSLEQKAHEYFNAKRIAAMYKRARLAQEELASNPDITPNRETELKRRINVVADKALAGNVTEKQALDRVQYVEDVNSRDHQAIRDLYDGWQALNGTQLQLLADTGVLSQETADEWKELGYISFKKIHERDPFIEAMAKVRKRDRIGRRASIEPELFGSGKKINIRLLDAMIGSIENTTSDALKNLANYRIAKMALRDNLFALETDRDQPGTIKYYEDGKLKYALLESGHEGLVEATQASGIDLLQGAMGIFPWFSNVLRQAVTRMPDFMVRNLFRDSISVWVTSGAEMAPLVDSTKRMFKAQTLKDAELLGIAMEHDFTNDPQRLRRQLRSQLKHWEAQEGTNVDAWTKTLEGFHRVWREAGDVSRRSDTATRMAVYDDVMKRTGNQAEAIHQAFEIIDFGRRGRNPALRFLTASIPFMNARLQGLDVLYRAGISGQYSSKRVDPKAARMAFLMRGAMLATATALYYAMVGDQEWYKDQRDEIKDDYWLIPTPMGTVLKAPAPFEVGVAFKTIPEMILRAAAEEGYGAKEFVNSMIRAGDETLGFGIVPQVAKPLVEAGINRDSYTNSAIVPEYMTESMPAGEQRTPNTTEMASMIGQATGVSPMKIEHMVRGYIGQLGMMLLALSDIAARNASVRGAVDALPFVDVNELKGGSGFPGTAGTRNDWGMARNVPILRSLITERGTGGGFQQRFYQLRSDLNKAIASINRAREEGRYEDFRRDTEINRALLNYRGTVRRLDRYLRRWRERRDRVVRSTAYSAEDKRRILRELEVERNRQLAVVPGIMDRIRGAE